VGRRASISGLVLAQDNAPWIGEVVDELGRICDEVLVADGGSRDGTPAIAAQRPFVRVVARPFDTYAHQRNFAVAHARGRWILPLDTDERLSDSAAALIPWLVRIPGLHRLHLPRLWVVRRHGRLHYLRGGPYFRDRQLRVYRRSMQARYCEDSPVHPPLHARSRGRGLRIRAPVIFHLCLLEDRDRREAKVARYRALDPCPSRERLHRVYLWEEVAHEHGIPIVPLPERYQERFATWAVERPESPAPGPQSAKKRSSSSSCARASR
jgi:glycosyltransferase involved in cell wall biosynthesis